MPHYRLHRDPGSSHQQIAAMVRSIGAEPVLDVGAAQGMLGQLLRGSGLAVDAVEPDAQCARLAEPHYRRVFAGPIEQAPLEPGAYRIIVCADVLEHTVDPAAVLRRLRLAAAEDAHFIISLPNVAHVAVRVMLLFGRFPKMDRGILDRTHLHFFTRDTAEQMLRETGLRIMQVSATPVPLEEVWPRRRDGRLLRVLMRTQDLAVAALPRLFGYQWIFLARGCK